MSLTPEDRQRIYEEEKARIEAQEKAKREQTEPGGSSLDRLSPNIAGLLCYVGGWVSGIIFLVLEEKNRFVRFHAAQSIVIFGTLNLISILFGWIPRIGGIIAGLAGAFSFIFWVVLMVKAYQGELYKVAIAGDLAERLAWRTHPDHQVVNSEFIRPPRSTPAQGDARRAREEFDRHPSTKPGRIVASAFAIAWSVVLLVLFNFFNRYIAYYNGDTVNGVTIWARYPLFTNDINLWLPILTLTLVLTIIFHIILLIFDKYILRQSAAIVLNVFGLATVLSLLSIFPFDFSVIPDATAADITRVSATMVLIFIAVGIGVSILVELIKLIVHLASGKINY
jgi:uncharacterized membrane protein